MATHASFIPDCSALPYRPDGAGPSAAPFIDAQILVPNTWQVLDRRRTLCVIGALPLIEPDAFQRRALAETARHAVVVRLGAA